MVDENGKESFLLIFEGHRPMPIREERVAEYAELIRERASHLIGGDDPEEG